MNFIKQDYLHILMRGNLSGKKNAHLSTVNPAFKKEKTSYLGKAIAMIFS